MRFVELRRTVSDSFALQIIQPSLSKHVEAALRIAALLVQRDHHAANVVDQQRAGALGTLGAARSAVHGVL